MNVIARKKEGVGIMYLVCTLLSTVFVGVGIGLSGEMLIIALLGLALLCISGYVFIQYVMLPYDVISIDREDNLHLPKGKVINIKDVLDVSYRRASARHIQYKWGSVTLKTRLGTFKYGYIADCEQVSKILTDMVYHARYAETMEEKS